MTKTDLAALGSRLPPGVHFGTSTWTYPGWQGIVYHRAYPAAGAGAAMLAEYASYPLFRTVGIDSAFYAPPSATTLASYAAALPAGFRCVSKVWDELTIHTFSKAKDKKRGGQPNPNFLRPDLFAERVLSVYQEQFADHMGPFVFEFQRIPSGKKGMQPGQFAEALDTFFSALPRGPQYSVELRNPEFLVPEYFAALRANNVAHCFNSWTAVPAIGIQLDLPDPITADFVVARALLRPGHTYAQAVEDYQPYDRIRQALPDVRRDLVRLAAAAVSRRAELYALVNNRLEGCAPRTIEAVVRELVGDQEQELAGPED